MFSEFRFSDIVAVTNRVMDQAAQDSVQQEIEKRQAIEKARAAGTLDAIDRSKQYEDMQHSQLVKAVNDAFAQNRQLKKDIAARDEQLAVEHAKNAALIAIFSYLALEGLKALGPYALHVLSR
jgi:predicted NAD-dependent protein-ADP-ribosyltransferase YbiA (DUF1768 family)